MFIIKHEIASSNGKQDNQEGVSTNLRHKSIPFHNSMRQSLPKKAGSSIEYSSLGGGWHLTQKSNVLHVGVRDCSNPHLYYRGVPGPRW